MLRVATRIASRVQALLARRLPQRAGRGAGAVERLQEASLEAVACLGERADKRTRRRGGVPREARDERGPSSATSGRCARWRRAGRYTRARASSRRTASPWKDSHATSLRGPLAASRLEELAGGRLACHVAHPLSDGSTPLVLEPLELLGRLAALVPATGEHLTAYHGLLGADAQRRAEVIPLHPQDEEKNMICVGGWKGRRLDWATLLQRVYAAVVLVCSCGGEASGAGAPAQRARRQEDPRGDGPARAASRACAGPGAAAGRAGLRPGAASLIPSLSRDDYDQRLPEAA